MIKQVTVVVLIGIGMISCKSESKLTIHLERDYHGPVVIISKLGEDTKVENTIEFNSDGVGYCNSIDYSTPFSIHVAFKNSPNKFLTREFDWQGDSSEVILFEEAFDAKYTSEEGESYHYSVFGVGTMREKEAILTEMYGISDSLGKTVY